MTDETSSLGRQKRALRSVHSSSTHDSLHPDADLLAELERTAWDDVQNWAVKRYQLRAEPVQKWREEEEAKKQTQRAQDIEDRLAQQRRERRQNAMLTRQRVMFEKEQDNLIKEKRKEHEERNVELVDRCHRLNVLTDTLHAFRMDNLRRREEENSAAMVLLNEQDMERKRSLEIYAQERLLKEESARQQDSLTQALNYADALGTQLGVGRCARHLTSMESLVLRGSRSSSDKAEPITAGLVRSKEEVFGDAAGPDKSDQPLETVNDLVLRLKPDAEALFPAVLAGLDPYQGRRRSSASDNRHGSGHKYQAKTPPTFCIQPGLSVFDLDLMQYKRLLNLTCKGIGDKGAIVLSRLLANGACPHLQSLNLAYNRIGRQGLMALCIWLESGHASHLQRLHLQYNLIDSQSLSALLQAMAACRVTTLDLKGNAINDEGAKSIVHTVHQRGVESLETLNLSQNHLTNDGVELLFNTFAAPSVKRFCPNLKLVNVRRNLATPALCGRLSPLLPEHVAL